MCSWCNKEKGNATLMEWCRWRRERGWPWPPPCRAWALDDLCNLVPAAARVHLLAGVQAHDPLVMAAVGDTLGRVWTGETWADPSEVEMWVAATVGIDRRVDEQVLRDAQAYLAEPGAQLTLV